MFIDTHMHEMTYSPDSFLKLEEMVRIGKEKGLGALCITDHDSMGLKDYAAEYTARTGFPIFVGIEFYSLQGDIVAFGIEDYPKERIPAQDFIDLVKAQGGVPDRVQKGTDEAGILCSGWLSCPGSPE